MYPPLISDVAAESLNGAAAIQNLKHSAHTEWGCKYVSRTKFSCLRAASLIASLERCCPSAITRCSAAPSHVASGLSTCCKDSSLIGSSLQECSAQNVGLDRQVSKFVAVSGLSCISRFLIEGDLAMPATPGVDTNEIENVPLQESMAV
jgi:predicted alpha/beta-hydrolase family hydrolase